VFATVDAGDGRRAIAVVHDPAQAAASTTEDLAGAAIEVRPDGTAELG
jgi:acetyl-CoA C-acetyltransferase